jgi:hypothetical protein
MDSRRSGTRDVSSARRAAGERPGGLEKQSLGLSDSVRAARRPRKATFVILGLSFVWPSGLDKQRL